MGSTQHVFRAPRAPTMTQQQPRRPQNPPPQQEQQPLMPQQQALSTSPTQWSGRSAVPQDRKVQQQNGAGQQPRLQMPNNGARLQHPASHQSHSIQRQMPPHQQHLANNGRGHWMSGNATPNHMSLQRKHARQQHQVPHAGAQFFGDSRASLGVS